MWMASAPQEVEHKGSTMYYTPNILAQLGEHNVCMSVPCQECLTSQSNLLTLLIRKHVTRFLLSSNTLADLGVLTKVEYYPRFGPFTISWCPPRDAKNCDVCHVGVTACHPGGCMLPIM